MLHSSLVSMIDFILSKLRYLVFTKSKLLSLFFTAGQDSSSCWTSCIDLPLLNHLWPCCCLCIILQTALKWLVLHKHHTSCHMQGTASAVALHCNICSYLSSFFLVLPIILMFVLISSYSQIPLHLLYYPAPLGPYYYLVTGDLIMLVPLLSLLS